MCVPFACCIRQLVERAGPLCWPFICTRTELNLEWKLAGRAPDFPLGFQLSLARSLACIFHSAFYGFSAPCLPACVSCAVLSCSCVATRHESHARRSFILSHGWKIVTLPKIERPKTENRKRNKVENGENSTRAKWNPFFRCKNKADKRKNARCVCEAISPHRTSF